MSKPSKTQIVTEVDDFGRKKYKIAEEEPE